MRFDSYLCLFLSLPLAYSFLPNLQRRKPNMDQVFVVAPKDACYLQKRFGLHSSLSSWALFASANNGDDPSSPFVKASAAFEAAHAEDPRTITVGDTTLPYSVHYHRRMAHWLDQLAPDNAPEVVKLAVRCQHIRRWTRPRADYPKGLVGYKKWRTDLAVFHAQQAAEILLASGYSEEVANRVGELLRKKNLESDSDVQLLEDVICVVFLENEYTAFIEEQDTYDDDKLVDIVQKTWKKMTPRGHAAALQLADQLTERGLRVVQRALEE